MPTYVYQCPKCRTVIEETKPSRQRANAPDCPDGCGPCQRNHRLESVHSDAQDYDKAILSDRMGVNPEQVPAHRKAFPNIPITDDGRIIVRNGAEERRINQELKKAFG